MNTIGVGSGIGVGDGLGEGMGDAIGDGDGVGRAGAGLALAVPGTSQPAITTSAAARHSQIRMAGKSM
jgi:hypothetical protein